MIRVNPGRRLNGLRVFSRSLSAQSSSSATKNDNIRVTLFSKENCGLCTRATTVVEKVLTQEQFGAVTFNVKDIDRPENKEWWTKYCLDVPVVHVERGTDAASLVKIFHRVDEKELETAIQKVEGL
ncbi:LAMI_0D03862g1_1 [Lachancea mirantina]|uniref:Glutaredoxin-like protein n=1 Tax=Lachancea mirantina TaxID=1230905 RepID=A0A1G4JA05_9SACH|nr:LAMI_0D03862g1_1 [Lachancea mirantina]